METTICMSSALSRMDATLLFTTLFGQNSAGRGLPWSFVAPCAKCPSDTRRLAYLRCRNMGLRTLWPVLRLSRMSGPTLVTSAVHICAAVGRFV